jgi:hypothetical protein
MLLRSEKGQGLAEYALILALIAIAAVLALLFLSGAITEHPQPDRLQAVTDRCDKKRAAPSARPVFFARLEHKH